MTGNTAILKLSSDFLTVIAQLTTILEEAECFPDVMSFLAGIRSEIGDSLGGHPQTCFICFTGLKKVGLNISKLSAKSQLGQIWIKQVIAEMGG